MDSTVLLLAGGSALLAVVLVVLLLALLQARRGRARAEAERTAAREQSDRLEARLEELAGRLEQVGRAPAPAAGPAFVITDAGREVLPEAVPMVADRLVLSAAVGEPLVKAVAFGHGVRRALSAESRHRIRFAMRQETRRARKQRRREMREVWLAHKRAGRAGAAPDAGSSERSASAA